MAQKTITVEISTTGGPMAVELDGFMGVGCEAVMQAFTKGGEVIKDVRKPEYRAVNQNQVCQ